MGRKCDELLQACRYSKPAGVDFLLAQGNLLWPAMDDETRGHETQLAVGLLDMSQTAVARARLAMQGASFLEGRVSNHTLRVDSWAHEAIRITQAAGAQYLDWVIAVAAEHAGLLEGLQHTPGVGHQNLAGICMAVTNKPELIDGSRFDAVITARTCVSTEAAKVFSILSSLSASETLSCIDGHDLAAVLSFGTRTQLVDAFWDRQSSQLRFASAGEEEQLEQAKGAVLVLHVSEDDPDKHHWKKIVTAVRRKMSADSNFEHNVTINQRLDTQAGCYRHLDLICSV